MVASAYQWDAEDYAHHSSAQAVWAEELMAKLQLSTDEHLLDLGCGNGKISAQLARHLSNGCVVGIDASADMIHLARQTYADAGSSNLAFEQMDAREMRFEQPFNVSFSNAVLHWIKEHPAVLAASQRCLVPGGRLLWQMGGKGNAEALLAIVDEVTQLPKWRRYFKVFVLPYYFYSPEDYARWLPSAGFKAIRIELIPKVMQHEGRAGLSGWFRTTWMPYTDRVPAEMRDELIDDMVTAYLQTCPIDKQGKTNVSMVRLEVEAVRQ